MQEQLVALSADLDAGEFRGSITAYLDHGLLLVEDSSSQARHDEWDDSSSLVNARTDSLCLRTQLYVDGPVSIFAFSGVLFPSQVGIEIFDGEIDIPSRKIIIRDSDDAAQITVDHLARRCRISIFVDDVRFVGCAAILLSNADRS